MLASLMWIIGAIICVSGFATILAVYNVESDTLAFDPFYEEQFKSDFNDLVMLSLLLVTLYLEVTIQQPTYFMSGQPV